MNEMSLNLGVGRVPDSPRRSHGEVDDEIEHMRIYVDRLTRRGKLEHVTLIEEARNLAPARRDEDPPRWVRGWYPSCGNSGNR